ncbi:potassium transporter KefB [Paramagnetospirillum marisnigri]|uniref:Potassium transporter KefB n=1 Tax=Paramagnetospirillum marisnigri TaxID=1285242 RepID=A0A178MHC6_9PROT|nr:monovalent cation:proton antiporter-2 (CPA2) family protein [Paramagnetospirillum marisnigri]OAN48111.1 potassium transporter KefB [Paramagnetospirillum marisnigri]
MAEAEILFDVLFLLLAAVVVVPVLQRLGIPSVLGYLAAGVVLGPYTPGPVIDAETTRPLAEFGVVFLLFAIGLELPLSRLRTMRRYIFGLGLLQVLASGALLAGLAAWWGLVPAVALMVGATLALSSTATVLALLVERNEAVTHHGRVAVAVLIFQDLAVIPILALLPLLAGKTHDILPALGLAGLKAAGAVVVIFALGRLVLRPVYAFMAASRSPEVFTAATLLLVVAVSWGTAEAGMSMALGAFLAGLMLADSPYRHQVEADIEPFRGLLLGLFFMTVGMSINLPFVAARGGELLGLTVLVMASKVAVILILCRLLGIGMVQGVQVGFLLAQTGEFAFVILDRAMGLKLLPASVGQSLMAMTALSMVLTPVLAKLGRILSRRRQRREGEALEPTGIEHLSQHVIIAGYGRMGRAIARLLTRHHIDFIALDENAERVTQARKDGLPVYFGDASLPGVLRSAGIDGARAVVVTVGAHRQTERTVATVRRVAPGVPVVVRATDRIHEAQMHKLGATAVIPETVEASLQMAAVVLRSAGIKEDEVEASLNAYRSSRYGKGKAE